MHHTLILFVTFKELIIIPHMYEEMTNLLKPDHL